MVEETVAYRVLMVECSGKGRPRLRRQIKFAMDLVSQRWKVRDPLGGKLPHVQFFMNDGPSPVT